ncbi:sensor histidine kinase [Streptomyces neyagawaensis]|uniref:histidine kinase n=1 Tax=Streptomyces neyagawaensis TaxID=42238 RepID=A0ABV3B7J1_9ACTN
MSSFAHIRWRGPRGVRADASLAFGVFVLVFVAEGQRLRGGGGSPAALAVSWLLITAVCGGLLFRRRYPVGVGWFTVVATGAYYLVSDIDGPLVVVPVVALYGIAAQGRLRAAVAMAAAMVVGVSAGPLMGDSDVNGTAVFMLSGWLVAVVALGNGRHSRLAYAEEEARLRATEERLRIARELHDVIGHNISMINVQAGAALHRLKKHPAPQAEPALTAIKEGSRETLRELRATLDVLRRVDEDAPRTPAPGLARADELVASAKLAGLTVRIERTGPERALPAPVDLAAYRIVQESLTNAARHSGAARVTVRLGYGDRELALLVEDDGRGAAARPATTGGSGIAGMTERARALGGELTAGPLPDGGFAVRAVLPYGVYGAYGNADERAKGSDR